MPNGTAHQPLNLSLNAFTSGETAFAIGYAEMEDITLETRDGKLIPRGLTPELYVSVGDVSNVFPENHTTRETSTPGPCFEFAARIPGKMSGGPIFGGDGAVVRGVVSRSFSGQKIAYGAMLGPTMHLPLIGDRSFRSMMEAGDDGIAQIRGQGL